MLLLAAPASGQYLTTNWNADSGLPQNSVRGIAQTPDGYIWIATLNGIARFDGVRFIVFDKSNTHGLSSNRFVCMAQGNDGDLWFASEDGNLVRLHAGSFVTMAHEAGIPAGSILGVINGEDGSVWISSNGRIYRWHPQAGRFERQHLGHERVSFRSLWWMGTGFWAADGGKLLYLLHGRFADLALPKRILRAGLRRVAIEDDGKVWIETLDGMLLRKGGGGFETVRPGVETRFSEEDKRTWKIQLDDTLSRTLQFPSAGSETTIPFNVMLSDKQGNTWIGSERKGLFLVQKQLISVYSVSQGLAGANVYPVLRAANGDLWVGTWPAGLSRIRDGQVLTYTIKDGLAGLVSALAEDKDGSIWVASHGGICVLRNGRLVRLRDLPGEDPPLARAIYQNSPNVMLFGTDRGLYVRKGEDLHLLTTQDGMAANDVRVIIRDHAGSIWTGGYGGVTKMNADLTPVQRWTEKEGLPSNNVRAIYEDADRNIWIGTYDGGLGLFRNGRWTTFNADHGLFDNGVFQILEDSHQNLWMSSNHGIYRVAKPDLYRFADGEQKRIQSVGYGKADGMLNVECNGGSWPSGAKDQRGFLWFPTQDGVAAFNPDALTVSKDGPRVMIESVAVDHAELGNTQKVTITPGQSSLEIQYTALDFSRPSQINFRYKLEGIDREWEYAGQRRVAYYKHLPPGNYVFRLAAINSDGLWSQSDQTVPIEVIPPFYERWWFLALAALLAFGVLWAIWNYRIRQLQRVQNAQKIFSQRLISSQEAERRRIAAELHDSLGQRLIVINNLALFLLRPKGMASTEQDRRSTIQEISSEASAAMEETRAISYDLRPFQLDRLGLSKAIQGLVRTASLASQIEFTVDIDNIDEVFPEDLRINFFRIVQEAVNNIMKHSAATHSHIAVKMEDSGLVLTISDNGSGFVPGGARVESGPGGFGITGMRERAGLLNGTLKVQSKINAGTVLRVVFASNRDVKNDQ